MILWLKLGYSITQLRIIDNSVLVHPRKKVFFAFQSTCLKLIRKNIPKVTHVTFKGCPFVLYTNIYIQICVEQREIRDFISILPKDLTDKNSRIRKQFIISSSLREALEIPWYSWSSFHKLLFLLQNNDYLYHSIGFSFHLVLNSNFYDLSYLRSLQKQVKNGILLP